MASYERNLSNQRLFNVGVTRVRDDLTMVVDDRAKLERQLDHNPGNKTSALETLGRLDVDAKRGGRAAERFDPGPLNPVLLGLPAPADVPAEPRADARSETGTGAKQTAAPPVPDRAERLPPLPERSLGLDL